MHGHMFTIVSAEDPDATFLWGVEVLDGDQPVAAVVYRPDSETGEPMFGVHASAEAARLRYDPIIPMDLLWVVEEGELSELNPPDGPGEAAAPGRPPRE